MYEIYKEFTDFFNKKVINPLMVLLNEGVTPKKLALAVTLGIVFGIFPVIGITTILCAAVAIIFQLNMVAIQIINYVVYPIQLLLLLPFAKIGAIIFNLENLLSTGNFTELTNFIDILKVFRDLYQIFLGAIMVWFVFAMAIGFIIFRVLYKVFKRKTGIKKYY